MFPTGNNLLAKSEDNSQTLVRWILLSQIIVIMGKIMKVGKVVLVLNGRYAGRKAVVVKGKNVSLSRSLKEAHCLKSVWIPCTSRVNISPRYMVDIAFDKSIVNKEVLKDPAKRRKARRDVKAKFEERYKTGKSRWFFQKLRF
ncbi:60S ribosomal protein L27 [Trichonephila inaurata madagascariensis]|uniref:60S ribosomal protein L27 n=1 Tax=Trichonephila inaurata madagascariensis TaxID=2747483 RepID=A0A8X6ISK8_9ARAC|nr:60S ribosomal protein L27 [Trichonephila inaurata madagascariensis]